LRQSVERKFEEYRKTIKDSHQVDIKNFKEKLRGGMADGKAITDYDLGQLLEGIKWEREHTSDSLLALEIAMDHLERIPDLLRSCKVLWPRMRTLNVIVYALALVLVVAAYLKGEQRHILGITEASKTLLSVLPSARL
jgi:hypothetical protein